MSIPKWNVDLTQAKQQNLRITRTNEGTITVDDLKIAQFIHTILNNENVRNVIDTLTTKLVLILGRFTTCAPDCSRTSCGPRKARRAN